MKLWRLTQSRYAGIDGQGTALYGSRYAPPGTPMVNFADEAGLAVLVALRYSMAEASLDQHDYVLGWTIVDDKPMPISETDDDKIRDWVMQWLQSKQSLLSILPSKVLPEANIVLMNPLHPSAKIIPPMTYRSFRFSDTLHRPPMLDQYKGHI